MTSEAFVQFQGTYADLVNVEISNIIFEDYADVCVSYKCKECSFLCPDKTLFYNHCLAHLFTDDTITESHIFVCSVCGQAYNTHSETKDHMREVHGRGVTSINNITIDEELKSNEASQALNISIEKKKAKTRKKRAKYKMRGYDIVACSWRGCTVSFSNLTDAETHAQCHLEGDLKTYSCFVCSMLFHTWRSCVRHLYQEHEINCGLLECTICKTYKTWAPLNLENHMRIHSDLRAFTCKTCDKSFKQASQLRAHCKTHEVEPIKKNSIQCTLCFKVYSSDKILRKHKNEVHSKLRPFLCNVCGYASARRLGLAVHQRQHTGSKPYECSLCEYTTADHNCLRDHVMRHTGVRPYRCPACTFSGIRSANLKRHLIMKHPDRELVFSCDRCPYKTVSEDLYARHISDHLTGLIKGSDPKMARVAVPKGFEKWQETDPDSPTSVASEDDDLDEADISESVDPAETEVRETVIINAADF